MHQTTKSTALISIDVQKGFNDPYWGPRNNPDFEETATFDRLGYDGRWWKAEDIHHSALASLHREFATVLNSDLNIDFV